MKPLITFIVLTLLFSFSLTAQDQKNSRDKSEGKEKKKINPFGKGLKNMDGFFKNKNDENGVETIEDENYEGHPDVEITYEDDDTDYVAEPNDFLGSFTMEMIEYKKGKMTKDSPMKIHYYFDEYKIAFVPETNEGESPTMIYDLKDKTMTSLIDNDGKKTAMKMKMPKIKVYTEDEGGEESSLNAEVTKTNETKVIDGYNVTKYLINTEEYKGYAWVTEDIDLNYSKLFSFLSMDRKGSATGEKMTPMDITGLPLESHTESKKKDQAFDTFIKNLKTGKVDQSVFDESGYEVMDMTNMMNFQKDN